MKEFLLNNMEFIIPGIVSIVLSIVSFIITLIKTRRTHIKKVANSPESLDIDNARLIILETIRTFLIEVYQKGDLKNEEKNGEQEKR